MNVKKLHLIVFFIIASFYVNAQERYYLFYHGQVLNGKGYNCGSAKIFEDKSLFLSKSEYQAERNKWNTTVKNDYAANKKTFKQNPYAELVQPNQVMIVLYVEQNKKIGLDEYCTNTFYESFIGSVAQEVEQKARHRIKSDPSSRFSIFRKIVGGVNVFIDDKD